MEELEVIRNHGIVSEYVCKEVRNFVNITNASYFLLGNDF